MRPGALLEHKDKCEAKQILENLPVKYQPTKVNIKREVEFCLKKVFAYDMVPSQTLDRQNTRHDKLKTGKH